MRVNIYVDTSGERPVYLLNLPYGSSVGLKRRTVILPSGFRAEKAVSRPSRQVRRYIIAPDWARLTGLCLSGHSNLPAVEWQGSGGASRREVLTVISPDAWQRVMVYRYRDNTSANSRSYWSCDPEEGVDGVFIQNTAIAYLPEWVSLCQDATDGAYYFEVQVDPVVRELTPARRKGEPFYRFAPHFTDMGEDGSLILTLPAYIPGFMSCRAEDKSIHLVCPFAEPRDVWDKPTPRKKAPVEGRTFLETTKFGPGMTTVLKREPIPEGEPSGA